MSWRLRLCWLPADYYFVRSAIMRGERFLCPPRQSAVVPAHMGDKSGALAWALVGPADGSASYTPPAQRPRQLLQAVVSDLSAQASPRPRKWGTRSIFESILSPFASDSAPNGRSSGNCSLLIPECA